MFRAALFTGLALITVAPSRAQMTQRETFKGGVFNNPFFHHAFEFDQPCCWELVNREDVESFMLHLRPNFDVITFDLQPGRRVESVSVTVLDFEGGFTGRDPTSSIVIRAASGDFVALHAAEIGALETVSADRDTPGQLSGLPLGEIVAIELQSANEGNELFPSEIGGFFDDITVRLVTVCMGDVDSDGDVDLSDLATLLSHFGENGGAAPEDGDLDGDQDVDLGDLAMLLSHFGAMCP